MYRSAAGDGVGEEAALDAAFLSGRPRVDHVARLGGSADKGAALAAA